MNIHILPEHAFLDAWLDCAGTSFSVITQIEVLGFSQSLLAVIEGKRIRNPICILPEYRAEVLSKCVEERDTMITGRLWGV